jgi:biotin carboxyl carrier protein
VTVDVEIGGRRRRVELERAGGAWMAAIDGRAVTLDAVQVRSGWSLLLGPAEAGHSEDATRSSLGRTSFDVSVDDRGRGALTVYVGGRAIEASVIDPRAYARRGRDHGAGGRSGLRQVTAPMPGRVLKVLVKPGDHVAARQGLAVIEAMKMENELRAPGDGVVREVRTVEGASVEAGTILVILE